MGSSAPSPLGLHLPRDGADDPELGEEGDTFRAFKLRSRAGKVVDAAQADLGLLGLQNHHVAVHGGSEMQAASLKHLTELVRVSLRTPGVGNCREFT